MGVWGASAIAGLGAFASGEQPYLGHWPVALRGCGFVAGGRLDVASHAAASMGQTFAFPLATWLTWLLCVAYLVAGFAFACSLGGRVVSDGRASPSELAS